MMSESSGREDVKWELEDAKLVKMAVMGDLQASTQIFNEFVDIFEEKRPASKTLEGYFIHTELKMQANPMIDPTLIWQLRPSDGRPPFPATEEGQIASEVE
jgi:hypothetical protein